MGEGLEAAVETIRAGIPRAAKGREAHSVFTRKIFQWQYAAALLTALHLFQDGLRPGSRVHGEKITGNPLGGHGLFGESLTAGPS